MGRTGGAGAGTGEGEEEDDEEAQEEGDEGGRDAHGTAAAVAEDWVSGVLGEEDEEGEGCLRGVLCYDFCFHLCVGYSGYPAALMLLWLLPVSVYLA